METGDQIFDRAIAAANALRKSPIYLAYIRSLVEVDDRDRRRLDAEEAAQREAIEVAARKKRDDRTYDMLGGMDPCASFGLVNGCHPCCPLFCVGKCPIQDENEENFVAIEQYQRPAWQM